MRLALVRRAVVAAAAISLLAIQSASAERLVADGDVVSPGIQGIVDLGSTGPGQDVRVNVGFVLQCTGTSHVDAGQVIRLQPGARTIPPGGGFSVNSLDFSPGAGWPADGEACPAGLPPLGIGPTHVVLTAPFEPGLDYRYSFTWNRILLPSTAGDASVFEAPTATAVFLLDVVDVPVNTPPQLHLPASSTVEGNTTGGAIAAYSASASDVEDAVPPSPTCAPAVGSVLPLGTNTIACSVMDGGGLTDTGSFTITVEDTTAPSLSGMPADLSLSTGDSSGAVLTYSPPTANDIVDPAPVVGCSPTPGSTAPLGDTTVTCTGSDASGNIASASFSVHVGLARAIWEEPVGGDGMTVKGSRTIPIKVNLFVDGQRVTSGHPTIAGLPCGGGASVETMDLTWQGRRWVGHLSTAGLAPGCYQVVAIVDGLVVGSFQLEVRGENATAASRSSHAVKPTGCRLHLRPL